MLSVYSQTSALSHSVKDAASSYLPLPEMVITCHMAVWPAAAQHKLHFSSHWNGFCFTTAVLCHK